MTREKSFPMVGVGVTLALLSGCASEELLKRMDMAERNIRTLDRNGAAFEAAFKQQGEVGNAQARELQALKRLIDDAYRQQQAQAQDSREMRRILDEARAITSRLEVRRMGTTDVIVIKQ